MRLPIQMTLFDNEAETVHPRTLKQLETDFLIMKNISMLMDMVHTLQG